MVNNFVKWRRKEDLAESRCQDMLKNKIKAANLFWFGLLLIIIFFHCQDRLDSDEGVVLSGACTPMIIMCSASQFCL